MSAQMLRDAAKVLRERAEKATPGPWDCDHHLDDSIEVNAGSARTQWRTVGPEGRTRLGTAPSSWRTTDRIIEHDADSDFNEPEEIEQRESDADYIATMHPGIGLALADWLDSEFGHDFGPTEHAITVARLILAGAS